MIRNILFARLLDADGEDGPAGWPIEVREHAPRSEEALAGPPEGWVRLTAKQLQLRLSSLTARMEALRSDGVSMPKGGWRLPPPLNRAQLRHGMLRLGITQAMVLDAIEAIPNAIAREEAHIDFTDAPSFHFNAPLLMLLAAHFELTDGQIREAWVYALTK